MGRIQQDVTDVISRRMAPVITDMAQNIKSQLTQEERVDVEKVTALLQGWDGNFDEESIAGTVFWQAHLRFYLSLFHQYEADEDERLAMTDGYAFFDFWQRMLADVTKNGAASKYQKLCRGADPGYQGENHCEYNVGRSLSQAIQFLRKNISEDPQKWKWINVHTQEYTNLPWSRTPLRFLFHKSVPVAGNTNTPNVAKTGFVANKGKTTVASTHAANYKQIITLTQDARKDVNLYSIDTGVGAHPLRGNYFDMNRNHLDGKLYKMRIGKQVEEVPTTTLIVHPRAKK